MTDKPIKKYEQITPSRERQIIEIIDTWDAKKKKLTREELVRRVKCVMGLEFSRQGLMKRPDIKTAFDRREKEITGGKPPRAEAEPLVVVLERQVEDLKAQVADRDKQIDSLNQLFVTYRYNAQQLGITPEQLEKAIPARGQTERGKS